MSDDSVKKYYDHEYHAGADGAFGAEKKRYRAFLEGVPEAGGNGCRALDIGCGAGTACALLLDRGYETYGVDLAETAVAVAAKNLPRAHFKAADASLGLDFPDGHFDVVTCLGVLEHLPDPLGLLREANRVLADDGVAIFVVPNALSPYFLFTGGTGQVIEKPLRYGSWEKLFASAGFMITHAGRDPGDEIGPRNSLSRNVKLALHKAINRLPRSLTYQFIFTLRKKAAD